MGDLSGSGSKENVRRPHDPHMEDMARLSNSSSVTQQALTQNFLWAWRNSTAPGCPDLRPQGGKWLNMETCPGSKTGSFQNLGPSTSSATLLEGCLLQDSPLIALSNHKIKRGDSRRSLLSQPAVTIDCSSPKRAAFFLAWTCLSTWIICQKISILKQLSQMTMRGNYVGFHQVDSKMGQRNRTFPWRYDSAD